MSTFADTGAQRDRKPQKIVVLAPSSFAFDYPQRPSDEVALGLRTISERDVQIAKAEASKAMIRTYGEPDGSLRDPEKAFEYWNDAFTTYALARATCDANDIEKPYFPRAEDTIGKALTSEALQKLWAEYSLMSRTTGDRAKIGDDEAEQLGKALERGALRGLEAGVQGEVRKCLAWVHEQMAGVLDAAEDEEDVSVYEARAVSPPLT